jgi:hypothetical protein
MCSPQQPAARLTEDEDLTSLVVMMSRPTCVCTISSGGPVWVVGP